MEKWKKNKGFIILTSLITLLPMMAGIFLWQKLPDQMATHFDFQNVPNGWSSKTFAVFGLPLFILAGHLFCTFYTSADPKRQHINDKLYRLVLLLCPAISVICGIAIYGYAEFGQRLHDELRDSEVEVKYIIDRSMFSGSLNMLPIYRPDEMLPEIDAVIVTPVWDFDQIKEQLVNRVKCPIISLEEVITGRDGHA